MVMLDRKAPQGAVARHVVQMRCSKMNVYLERYPIRWNHLIRGFAFLNRDLECGRRSISAGYALERSLISLGHGRMNAMPRIDIEGSPRAMAK
jgi:hypothetical protein